MAERIVNLLELVEINKQESAMTAAPRERERPIHLLTEEGPVRQASQRIIARKVADLGFRVFALGNVFHQDYRTAISHRMEGKRECSTIANLDRQIAVDVVSEIAIQLG